MLMLQDLPQNLPQTCPTDAEVDSAAPIMRLLGTFAAVSGKTLSGTLLLWKQC